LWIKIIAIIDTNYYNPLGFGTKLLINKSRF
jgi:hypothetical protein